MSAQHWNTVVEGVIEGIRRSANFLADEAMISLAEQRRARGIEFDLEHTGAIRNVVFDMYVDALRRRLLAGLREEYGRGDGGELP